MAVVIRMGCATARFPLLPRILQVVDIYDALRTERPYKPALGHEQAAVTMRAEARAASGTRSWSPSSSACSTSVKWRKKSVMGHRIIGHLNSNAKRF
jgi:hypothetical protein